MKNLFFLLIICVGMISWAVNSTSEKTSQEPINIKEVPGTCSNDNFSFAGIHNSKQCSEPKSVKVSNTDQNSCNTISEKENSCSTTKECKGGDRFWSAEAKCSKEDKKQCNNSATALVNSSASL